MTGFDSAEQVGMLEGTEDVDFLKKAGDGLFVRGHGTGENLDGNGAGVAVGDIDLTKVRLADFLVEAVVVADDNTGADRHVGDFDRGTAAGTTFEPALQTGDFCLHTGLALGAIERYYHGILSLWMAKKAQTYGVCATQATIVEQN